MEDLFIIVPSAVTLEDLRAVLARTWKLSDDHDNPYIDLDHYSRAYVEEESVDDDFLAEFFLEHPGMPERLQEDFGRYRVMALRYRDPALAREMARVIASSELNNRPMLLNADGTYLSADAFLRRLGEAPPWDWFGQTMPQTEG
jgi:hypothetical protein